MHPSFPEFKPIELEDRNVIHEILRAYQPQTSELTFTNLFIWRAHYHLQWSMHRDWLILVARDHAGVFFAFPPVGPPTRAGVARDVLDWLKNEKQQPSPGIERVDESLAAELEGTDNLVIEPVRDQFDYVYRTEDLIHLAGRKYHSRKNQLNKFLRTYSFTYEPMNEQHLMECRNLSDRWCELRRCCEDLNLSGEWDAVRESLLHFGDLKLRGGVIRIDDTVQAFSVGELLNAETIVVHIEKANPELPGLYTAINQQVCEHGWKDIPFVNREQDLGEEGLRKAKLSYHPHHLVKKFRVRTA